MPSLFAGEWGIAPPALAIAILALTALAHVSLRWWARRRARGYEAGGSHADQWRLRRWLARAFVDLVPAVALLIWIQGLWFISALFVRQLAPQTLIEPLMLALRWAYGLSVIGAMAWLLSRLGALIDVFLHTLSTRADTAWDDVVLPLAGKVARRALPLLALIFGVSALPLSPALAQIVDQATSLLLIGVVGFILFQIVDATATFVLQPHRLDVTDNLQARAIHTQVMVLKKVAVTIIGVFTLASMLMVFDSVRQFGASILASAGIAGIVVGLAAQRSIATLLAGFQIALTQPIRVDDVVIVENEWGRIEDITLTYVVVRIWDQRSLVVPITYFIEKPFQNWTRASADILGSVFLHLDYSVPVDRLRLELTRILNASRYWDGRVNALQVTEAKEHTLELRALASAADASQAWDLRCEIREKLIAFVQQNYPDSLPRIRGSFSAADVDGEPALASSLHSGEKR
jgi:small-conductance mechanosensitive channel